MSEVLVSTPSSAILDACRRSWRLVLAPVSLILLAGCASLTIHQAPNMPVPASFAASGTAKPADNTRTQWWLAFRDPLLNRLVDRGLKQNLDIAQAIELIREANAGMISAGAAALPSASGSVVGSLEQQGEDPATSSIT